jgi:hypothetical protein
MPVIKQNTTIANVSAAALRKQKGPLGFNVNSSQDLKPDKKLNAIQKTKQTTPSQLRSLLKHYIYSFTYQISKQRVNKPPF